MLKEWEKGIGICIFVHTCAGVFMKVMMDVCLGWLVHRQNLHDNELLTILIGCRCLSVVVLVYSTSAVS